MKFFSLAIAVCVSASPLVFANDTINLSPGQSILVGNQQVACVAGPTTPSAFECRFAGPLSSGFYRTRTITLTPQAGYSVLESDCLAHVVKSGQGPASSDNWVCRSVPQDPSQESTTPYTCVPFDPSSLTGIVYSY